LTEYGTSRSGDLDGSVGIMRHDTSMLGILPVYYSQ
jgi:hypothetical protein